MDYDSSDIAATYDRGRVLAPDVLGLWMRAIGAHVSGPAPRLIVDLGAGTGRFSEALAQYFDATVVGVDPSRKMLQQAARKRADPRVRYVRGRAECIPIRQRSTDLLFMSMVFHHFADPAAVARESRRILRGDGTIFLRAASLERVPFYPQVAFFPSSRRLMEERLPSMAAMQETFMHAGFQILKAGILHQQVAADYTDYAEKIAAGADSILADVSRDEFEAGIAAIRRQSAAGANEPVVEPIDFLVCRAPGVTVACSVPPPECALPA